MTSLRSFLTELLSTAFAELGYDPGLGDVTPSQRPDLGQFQCSGALAAARQYRRKPEVIANEVIDRIRNPELFADVSFAAPGFINLTLTDEFLASFAGRIGNDERLGCSLTPEPRTVIVDFGGPNIAK